MAVTYRAVHEGAVAAIEAATSFKESKTPINPRRVPRGQAHQAFAIEFDTVNEDTLRDRDSRGMQAEHSMLIWQVHKTLPKNQGETYRIALDDDDTIRQAMMDQDETWQQQLRIRYVATERTWTPSGEWLISQYEYTVKHLSVTP